MYNTSRSQNLQLNILHDFTYAARAGSQPQRAGSHLKFLDSMGFLMGSLDTLSKNLVDEHRTAPNGKQLNTSDFVETFSKKA